MIYEDIKVELLTLLRREMNGAVVESMNNLDAEHKIPSYGVSVPTIKSICSGFTPSQRLANHLFKSKVRELKLSAIFFSQPSEITSEIIDEWSQNMGNLEIMQHITMLFAKSPYIKPFLPIWLDSKEPMFLPMALLIISKIAQTVDESAIYCEKLLSRLDEVNGTNRNAFIAASVKIANNIPELKTILLEKQNGECSEIAAFL